MALSADRATPRWGTPDGPVMSYQLAASTTIWSGAMVALDAAGKAHPASKTAGLKVVGRAEARAVSGASDEVHVEVRAGVFRWNVLAADKPLQADIGALVYADDDETVKKTAGANAPTVGRLAQVDAAGAWVFTGMQYRQ